MSSQSLTVTRRKLSIFMVVVVFVLAIFSLNPSALPKAFRHKESPPKASPPASVDARPAAAVPAANGQTRTIVLNTGYDQWSASPGLISVGGQDNEWRVIGDTISGAPQPPTANGRVANVVSDNIWSGFNPALPGYFPNSRWISIDPNRGAPLPPAPPAKNFQYAYYFTLPDGFSNAVLTMKLSADDQITKVTLNSAILFQGSGGFFVTPPLVLPASPLTSADFNSGSTVNVLTVEVEDTHAGITGVVIDGTVTYQDCDRLPIRDLPNLTSITFWERTSASPTSPTFPVSAAQLATKLSGTLSSTNSDFAGVAGSELYDVFYSGWDGTPNPDGEFVTIEAVWPVGAPSGGGLNIARVDFNGTGKSASSVASFVALGNNALPGGVGKAVDVDPSVLTATTMGNTIGQTQRLRITVGFPGPCLSLPITINPATLTHQTWFPYLDYPALNLTATGGTGPYAFTVSGGALPPGMILDPNGILHGKPSATGAYTFTVTAADTYGALGVREYQLTVSCPQITLNPSAGALAATVIDTPYSQTFIATGGCTSVFTYRVTRGALPLGLTLSNDGVLSGTAQQADPFTFDVTATDSCGCSLTQNYYSLRAKLEQLEPDLLDKEETASPTRIKSPVAAAVYDVGVIPGSGSCPVGSERITIYMDDEDKKNANSRSGWMGAIVSDHNTKFVFCRVDGTKFQEMPSAYAVLQLSPSCPPGTFSFFRYFDNEDTNNENGFVGSIYPNLSSAYYSDTELHFCLFPPDSIGFGNSFPNLGMEYGVFGSQGLADGHLHTDDEDKNNENSFDFAYATIPNNWASQIISGTKNTDISITKVQNKPPPCQKKVVSYNGSLLSATFDGANCYIKAVVPGGSPFIYNNGYYIKPDKSNTCLVGSFDGANCYYMPQPAGGFIYNDAFYVKPGPGNSCSQGTFDGANCFIKAAPWGTHVFLYQNSWYFTPLYTCKDGGYDSANCYIMKAPTGTVPFIYNNAFYYGE